MAARWRVGWHRDARWQRTRTLGTELSQSGAGVAAAGQRHHRHLYPQRGPQLSEAAWTARRRHHWPTRRFRSRRRLPARRDAIQQRRAFRRGIQWRDMGTRGRVARRGEPQEPRIQALGPGLPEPPPRRQPSPRWHRRPAHPQCNSQLSTASRTRSGRYRGPAYRSSACRRRCRPAAERRHHAEAVHEPGGRYAVVELRSRLLQLQAPVAAIWTGGDDPRPADG